MAATGIHEMRHPHDAVLDFILANPFASLRDVSRFTGYTIPWLSQMIRSDVFQAEYERRRNDVESGIMLPIRQRLEALSHLACDALEAELQSNCDPQFALDAFDKVLHRAGYAPNKITAAPVTVQNTLFVVQRDELDALRGQIVQGTLTPSLETVDGLSLAPPEDSGVGPPAAGQSLAPPEPALELVPVVVPVPERKDGQ